MEEVCEYTLGGGTPKTNVQSYWNGNIPWIQSSDIENDQLINVIPKKHITRLAIKESSSKLIPRNSISIVTRVGVGKISLFDYEYSTSQDFLSLCNLLTEKYFTTYLLYKKLEVIKRNLQGTSIKGITKDELLKNKVRFPIQIKEQASIGEFLLNLDNTITLLQRKINNLNKVKKGLLQKLFPTEQSINPRIRFNGFNQDWEQREFRDIIKKLFGGTSISPNDYQENGIRTIPKGAVNNTGVANLSGSKYVSEAFFKLNKKSKVSSNDLVTSLRDLVPSAPSMGRIVKISGPNEEFLMPQGVYKLVLYENIDENFLITYSNGENYRKIISQEKSGSTQVHIRNEEFLNIRTFLPSYNEQNEIGQFFKEIDKTITLLQKELEMNKQIKKGFLQKLFPKE